MDISQILSVKYSGQEWVLNGDSYDGLEWLSDSPKPSEAELKKQWADVQYELELESVSQARHIAYTAPGGSDSVFMKYQRGEASKQDWLDAVNAINDSLPYPVKG